MTAQERDSQKLREKSSTNENSRLKFFRKESILRPEAARENVADFELDANGFITSWSIKAEKLYGWDEVEILNQHVSNLYPRKDLEHGKSALELRATENRGAYFSFGWQRKKNGKEFWCYSESQIVRDNNGRVLGFRRSVVETGLSESA